MTAAAAWLAYFPGGTNEEPEQVFYDTFVVSLDKRYGSHLQGAEVRSGAGRRIDSSSASCSTSWPLIPTRGKATRALTPWPPTT
jgi:hypothetical protein